MGVSRTVGALAVFFTLCLVGCDTGGTAYRAREGLRFRQGSLDAVPGWSQVRTPTGTVYLDPDVVLGSRDIEYVQDGGCSGGACHVNFRFTANGARRMARFSTSHIGRYLAIVVDDKVVTVASIAAPMTDSLQETLSSRQEAEDLLREVAVRPQSGAESGKGGRSI